MNLVQTLWALACVVAISCGQLLFKRAGLAIEAAGSWWSWRVFALVGVAGMIYAVATLAWINLLRGVPLSTAYSYMALSFVLVPLAGHWLFSERFGNAQILGAVLIVAGLIVASRGG